MKDAPVFVMMAGLPGSGKSTYARKILAPRFNASIYSSDKIIEEHAAATGKTYEDVFREFYSEAKRRYFEQLQKALADRKNVIVDRTHLDAANRKPPLDLVPKHYRKLCYIIVPIKPDVLHERQKLHRQDKIIPLEVLESMYENYRMPKDSEGFDEVVYISQDLVDQTLWGSDE